VRKGGFRRVAGSAAELSHSGLDADDDQDDGGLPPLDGSLITDADLPLPLARFKVNAYDTLAVFKACTMRTLWMW